ncbi:MAG: hypothetical protein ACOVS5_12315 [Oligoflexus sp.]
MIRSFIIIGISAAVASCKMLPNTIRSELKNSEVDALLDVPSLQFLRQANGTQGELRFKLKDRHNCRVEYAATDPSGRPAPSAPASIDCPDDGGKLEKQLAIENISAGIPIVFRIYVWPKTLTGVSSAFKEFREDQDLAKIRTNYIVIARFNGPRNSNELYTYLFPKQMNLSEVKSTLQLRGPKENANCIEGAGETQPPFPRIRSQEDNPKRPLHGLTKVSTDGFAQGSAFIHPFFDTRLSQVFDAVDRQQNWQWNFDWNGRSYNFESYPPGYMASLDLIDGSNRTPLGNRQLGNVVPSYDVSARPFSLAPSILFPTEIASYQLTVKSANASRTLLRCDYTIDQQFLTVPAALYQKLAAGEYLVTVTLETNQIHFKDGGSYPPWLITAQDWVHFKINKKL